MDTLLLNACRQPVEIIPWQHAVVLVLDGSARLLEEYPERRVRSISIQLPWPAVIQDVTREARLGLRPSRRNVLARDRHRCLYCGTEPRTASGNPNTDLLTVDHVVPRCRAQYGHVEVPWRPLALVGLNDWENLATACWHCNQWKGASTPAEAGMELIARPAEPGLFASIRILMSRQRVVPPPWEPYLRPV